FPESHSVSFAYLVYSSSWIKLHHPAAFCAALLNAQPMGFYSPHTLVQDARRHGVNVRSPDVSASAAGATLEPDPASTGGLAVRLGIGSVRTIGDDLAERIAAGRPYADMEQVARHAELTLPQLEALATAGAFGCFPSPTPPRTGWEVGGPGDRDAAQLAGGLRTGREVGGPGDRDAAQLAGGPRTGRGVGGPGDRDAAQLAGGGHTGLGRREALWAAGAVAQSRPDRLVGIVTGADAPRLPGMDERETSVADLWATGVSPEGHPTRFLRAELDRLGVITSAGLVDVPDGAKVLVGGVVTHRQRPATASGTTFLNLEDETGVINIVCSKGCWIRHRRVARTSPALLVRGRLEKVEGVINVVAERFSLLPLSASSEPGHAAAPPEVGADPTVLLRSRDFR
ncbi:MAG: polymerase alpha subunit, partial [Acidimicrobiales bacterium]|nr:polymerase alpha subunit [Acidimicrobiales bacterium]